MTRLPSEEVWNAKISDPIAQFGDDDDDFFSCEGDGSGEQFGYDYTQYGSDVEIPEEDFCQMDAGQHSRQFQQGRLHNQDVTDAAGFIANTPDPDTPPLNPVLPSQTHDIDAFSYITPITNTSPIGSHCQRCTSAPPQICDIQTTPLRLPILALAPFTASRIEEQPIPTHSNYFSATRVRAKPVYSQIDNSPSGVADESSFVSCIWEQEGVLERYKGLIGDAKWSKYRHGEVDRWGKVVMSLVMLSRPAITLEVVHKLFDGYLL